MVAHRSRSLLSREASLAGRKLRKPLFYVKLYKRIAARRDELLARQAALEKKGKVADAKTCAAEAAKIAADLDRALQLHAAAVQQESGRA